MTRTQFQPGPAQDHYHDTLGASETPIDELGGTSVLEDPGNRWEQSLAVSEGYRLAEEIEGELRVFEAVQAGTTHATATGIADFTPDLSPLGVTEGGDVDWRYVGIVGELPWDVMPLTQGLPDNWTVDPEFNNVTITSPAAVGEYEYMLTLSAMDGETPVPVCEFTTAGDADFYLRDSGTSWRWKDTANGNSLALSVGQDNVFVRAQDNADLLHIDRQAKTVSLPALPTANPNVAGQLWNDGGTLKVSAG